MSRQNANPGQDGAEAERRPDDKPGGRHDPQRAAKEGSTEHARKSGRWGAEEASYGRPHGERPNPGQGGRANPKGPEFEQGGRYPGAREPGEAHAADKETGTTPKPGEGRRQRG